MAEEIVREEFKKNYAAYTIQKKGKKPQSSKKVNHLELILNQSHLLLFQRVDSSDDSSIEDAESDSSTEDEEIMTELDQYLKSPRVKDVTDPRQWWIANRASYPRLS